MARKTKTKKSGKAAAIEILRRSGKALPVKEVVAAALADPEVTGMKGKTPAATLSAALYTEAKKPDGAVILVERGMIMKARPQRKRPSGASLHAAGRRPARRAFSRSACRRAQGELRYARRANDSGPGSE
jgi:hypothetical protein